MKTFFRRHQARNIVAIILLFVMLFFLVKGMVWTQRFMTDTGLTPGSVARILFDGSELLKKSGGTSNILILGIGGGNHAGADLTDTMIVASVRFSDSRVALVSLPRDLWSATLKDRINSSYYYGEQKQTGGGVILTKTIVEDVTGLPIHYVIVLDFSGFVTLVDAIGGIDVAVSESFVDTRYPIEGKEDDLCDSDPEYGCRFETIEFTNGMQHMDGTRALAYVRSRNAQGESGTDFARSKRQQEVLVSVKDKIQKERPWLSPSYMKRLLFTVDEIIDTDMKVSELLALGKLLQGVHENQIRRISLEDLFYAPPTSWYGRYVLLPKEDFVTVHEYIQKELER